MQLEESSIEMKTMQAYNTIKIIFSFVLGLAAVFITKPIQTVIAAEYIVQKNESSISFSGVHAGREFKGKFGEWTAQIDFDPAHLTQAEISANFDLSSASTGNKMYDGTLPQSDWFDVKNYPTASFAITSITQEQSGNYKALGDLTLKGVTKPLEFTFSLSGLDTEYAQMSADFKIDRFAYGIGAKSDPEAEWVDRDISVRVNIKAAPAQ